MHKATAFLVLICAVAFAFPAVSSASVLYSTLGSTQTIDLMSSATAANNYYGRVIYWNGINTNAAVTAPHSGGIVFSSAPVTLRVLRYAGVGCGSIRNVLPFDQNGLNYGTIGTAATTTINGWNYCDFPFTSAPTSTQAFLGIFMCTGSGCNSVDGDIQLYSSNVNTGYSVKGGTPPDPRAGGFAFALCDSGGCGADPFTVINWDAYFTTPLYSTSSQAISASSSLWQNIAIASSSVQCSTGNVFGDALCSAGTYLFVPNPNILAAYTQLPTLISQRFPFSWVYQVQTTLATISASSTPNFQTAQLDFASLGIGSTTAMGNILPSFQGLSTTTIQKYMPAGTWNTIQNLIAAGLWLSLGVYIFFQTRDRLHRV